MTQQTRNNITVGIIVALVSVVLTYALAQANMESRYATKHDLDALAAVVAKQSVVADKQSETIGKVILALQAHLVKDDPTYKTPPLGTADWTPKGD